MEGENRMEKRLRVFRAHSRIFLWWSEVIWLLKSLRQGADSFRHLKRPINININLVIRSRPRL